MSYILICFVLLCWTRFSNINSSLIIIVWRRGLPFFISRSCINVLRHKSLQNLCVIAPYSADLATTNYFLFLQMTKFPPTIVQYANVDLLSSSDPAQLASTKASIFKYPWFENSNPLLGADFKYLKMQNIASRWVERGSCINWLTRLMG